MLFYFGNKTEEGVFMAMFRVQKDKDNPYVMLNKYCLNDENLSWKAKGILSYLLSLPDDWQIYENELKNHSKDSITALNSGIKELIEFGYIERTRMRDKNGRLGAYEYCVYEVPTKNGISKVGKSKIGETKAGKTDTTNNNLTYNNPTNNKESDKGVLHHLSEINNVYIISYLLIMKMHGYSHKRVNEDNFNYILDAMDKLNEYGVTTDIWKQEVYAYFENEVIGSNNDGDIIRFLKAGMRYFEIDFDR